MTDTNTNESSRPILIVDDDETITTLVSRVLDKAGFPTVSVAKGGDAVDWLQKNEAEVVILDFALPDITGLEVCRQVREFSDVYILMLTASHAEQDKIDTLTIGADDYLTKPFSPAELVLRVKAMLRRPRMTSDVDGSDPILEINPATRVVLFDRAEVTLTGTEFRLLLALAEAAPEPLSRKQLVEAVWQITMDDRSHMVDVHLSNLRRKLRNAGVVGKAIGNDRSIGFRLLTPAKIV